MFNNYPEEKSLLDKLIEAATFGADDLELNRQGKMSALQKSYLSFRAILNIGICILLFILAIGAIWAFIAQFQVIPFIAILLWVTLCVFGCIYWLQLALPVLEDVRSDQVLCISGPLHQIYTRFSTGRGSGIYIVHYRIAKKYFYVAFFVPKSISQDQRCKVYYTPKSKIIIGIEPT